MTLIFYLMIALLLGVFLGILIGVGRQRPNLDRDQRKSLVEHRQFVSRIERLAAQHAQTEQFAVIILDETDKFITDQNRSIK